VAAIKTLIFALALCVVGCASPEQPMAASKIDWDDGDSGTINGMDFRLSDVDAPETGGVGAAIGGAKCEAERELGKSAKAYMEKLTRGATLQVTQEYGEDNYGRMVIDLSANGSDVGSAGLRAGVLRSWDHEGTRALEPRPRWCEGAGS
jgi:endonuclease YncB( thermonuclease family)